MRLHSRIGPVALRRQHVAGRRARLRPDRALPSERLSALADRIAGLAGASRVLARPATGSLIVESDGPVAEVLDAIDRQGVARVLDPQQAPPVSQVLRLGALRADQAVRAQTGQALDLRTATALLLSAGAVVQLARGQIAGPATTLAMTAVALLDKAGGKGR